MIQSYTWHLTPPDGDVDRLCNLVRGPVGDLLRLNRWVVKAEIELEEEHLTLILTFAAHDRWWIRRRVPPLIASVAIRSRLPLSQLKHVGIRTEPTLKNARYWTQGWRKGQRVHEPPDGVERQPVVRERREREPTRWLHRTGWHSGDEVAGIDLRTGLKKRSRR